MSSQLKKYDVIYAGNYTKDTLITPDGTNVVNGGGMNYAANVGMRLGVKAASKYVEMGVKEVVLTHSNGVLIYAERKNYHFPFHPKSMAGRSGRGDTFMGLFVAKRISLPPKEAGKYAAAATSLKLGNRYFLKNLN
jgi:bifunctional ADP-heptose synthase (sugar kinase/adenylyltransferase)